MWRGYLLKDVSPAELLEAVRKAARGETTSHPRVAAKMPGLTALKLLYLIAAWAIVTGAFETAAAMRLRKQIEGEGLLVLSGVASVLFGVLLVAAPGRARWWWRGPSALTRGSSACST